MQSDAARAARHRLRYRVARISSLPSVQACSTTVLQHQGYVGVEVGEQGVGLTGLQTCGSVSACPTCSARIREQRARTIEAAGIAHLRRGGQLVFLTLTIPHNDGDDLADLIDTVVKGWKAVQDNDGWQALAEVAGLPMKSPRSKEVRNRLAFVRALEVTHGLNGWHPHLHVLVFAEGLTDKGFRAMQESVRDAWTAHVEARGWRTPEQFDFQRVVGVENREGLLRYLSKVQDGYDRRPGRHWGVHREMARADGKKGRRWHTRSPFQIAEDAADGGHTSLALWHEYERATKGKRVIQPSQGLFKHLGVADVLDEFAPDVQGETATVAELIPEDWRIVQRFRAVPEVLAAARAGGGLAVYDVLDRLRQWERALDVVKARSGGIGGLTPQRVLADYRRAHADRPAA